MSWSYSLAITESPAPCEVVSTASHGKPNPNGSVAALRDGAVELLLEVGEQLRLRDGQPGRVARLARCARWSS